MPSSRRRPSRHRTSASAPLAALALALVTAALAGCTSGAEPDASTSARPSAPPSSSAPAATAEPSEEPAPVTSPAEPPTPAAPAFDKSAMSIDDPASLWVVSDKLRPLSPIDYVPSDLVTIDVASQNPPVFRREAGDALLALFAAGEAEGAGQFQVQSAYRSYATQVSVYQGWVDRLGQAQADIQSARPGHSEHQTGLVADISPIPLSCALQACFGDTAQGQWLAANAWRYGWLLRYPADKTAVTGFTYEPWHFRYVGVPLATELHTTGVTTLEEFFGLPAAPTYAG
ncbi:M15 family metallopeptidase [Frigoribacterium sp. CFBP 13729]|nr:M15 family metallopeptidase [Frigoribacterium sp. CFBP 13729]